MSRNKNFLNLSLPSKQQDAASAQVSVPPTVPLTINTSSTNISSQANDSPAKSYDNKKN